MDLIRPFLPIHPLNTYPIVVIGGGAAGMIAAWRAAHAGIRTLLVEKNPRLGIKILISGGGKCNITHGGDMETLRRQFRRNEERFLKFAFSEFTNDDITSLLDRQGVNSYVREDGKVFPKSHSAKDVVTALQTLLEENKVDILCSSPVRSVTIDGSEGFVVHMDNGTIAARRVIVSVGGSSFRKTGTCGDGYAWAASFGHTIVPVRPALAPIEIRPVPPRDWQGTPIRQCEVIAHSGDDVFSRWKGDMLFTHTGISGPAVLEISREAAVAIENGTTVTISVDFLPDMQPDQAEAFFRDEMARNPSRQISTLLEHHVPNKLVQHVADQASVTVSKKLNQCTRDERKSIVQTLKRCSIGIVDTIQLDKGEVTAGGVDLREVDPSSMRSKRTPGLYFCGEILDIAGPVGGYNLQAAFSTGYVAGGHAARSLQEGR